MLKHTLFPSLGLMLLAAIVLAEDMPPSSPVNHESAQQPAGSPIPGIGPVGKITKLLTGFEFTEGPAADALGNVYFTDIPKERIHKVDSKGALTTIREKSGHANGLMVNSKGELVACEMDGRIVVISPDGKDVRPLASEYKGKRFNAPNDLVVDRDGGVYFTDPSFRAPMPQPQDKLAVYYSTPDGKVTRLIDNLPNPNGVMLSPDEKTLYVIPTGQAEMMAYPVEGPGKIGAGKVFCALQQLAEKKATGGDGCTIDSKGNLYVAAQLGIQVFDPSGRLLGIIAFPEQPANLTFGGPDLKTLYVTARTSLYTAPMEATGHRFPAGKK